MKAIRRIGLLLVVLFIGIVIGSFGWESALLIIAPLFFLWFMVWDERSYSRNTRKQQQNQQHEYAYRK